MYAVYWNKSTIYLTGGVIKDDKEIKISNATYKYNPIKNSVKTLPDMI